MPHTVYIHGPVEDKMHEEYLELPEPRPAYPDWAKQRIKEIVNAYYGVK